MKEPVKILYTEDKELYRKAILKEIEGHGIDCIGEAENGRELLRQLKSKKPDVILLDLEMPVMNGNETMDILMEEYPESKVLIMSLHDEQELMKDYLRRGAKGYIIKDDICGNINLLVEAIIKIHEKNETVPSKGKQTGVMFSNRQIEIIPLLCDELTNKQIAGKLGILERSVEKQRRRIYSKTNSTSATSFFKYAFKRGLDLLGRRNSFR